MMKDFQEQKSNELVDYIQNLSSDIHERTYILREDHFGHVGKETKFNNWMIVIGIFFLLALAVSAAFSQDSLGNFIDSHVTRKEELIKKGKAHFCAIMRDSDQESCDEMQDKSTLHACEQKAINQYNKCKKDGYYGNV